MSVPNNIYQFDRVKENLQCRVSSKSGVMVKEGAITYSLSHKILHSTFFRGFCTQCKILTWRRPLRLLSEGTTYLQHFCSLRPAPLWSWPFLPTPFWIPGIHKIRMYKYPPPPSKSVQYYQSIRKLTSYGNCGSLNSEEMRIFAKSNRFENKIAYWPLTW